MKKQIYGQWTSPIDLMEIAKLIPISDQRYKKRATQRLGSIVLIKSCKLDLSEENSCGGGLETSFLRPGHYPNYLFIFYSYSSIQTSHTLLPNVSNYFMESMSTSAQYLPALGNGTRKLREVPGIPESQS